MKLELKYYDDKDLSINSLSPSMIKKLLYNVIKRKSDDGQYYSPERFVASLSRRHVVRLQLDKLIYKFSVGLDL